MFFQWWIEASTRMALVSNPMVQRQGRGLGLAPSQKFIQQCLNFFGMFTNGDYIFMCGINMWRYKCENRLLCGCYPQPFSVFSHHLEPSERECYTRVGIHPILANFPIVDRPRVMSCIVELVFAFMKDLCPERVIERDHHCCYEQFNNFFRFFIILTYVQLQSMTNPAF